MCRSFCRGCGPHCKDVDWATHHSDKGKGWKAPHQWEQGPPRFQETHKAARLPEIGDKHGFATKDKTAGPALLEATRQLADAWSEDEEQKDAVMALQTVPGKKKEAEPV